LVVAALSAVHTPVRHEHEVVHKLSVLVLEQQ